MTEKMGGSEQQQSVDVLIIGAGLTGLTLNYLLRDSGLDVVVVEARERIGGRILTLKQHNEPTVEMGATWFGPKHTRLVKLMEELGVGAFPQQLGKTAIYEYMSTSPPQLVTLPENEEPSYRIRGGTSFLIERLAAFLEKERLFLHSPVAGISQEEQTLVVSSGKRTFTAKYVVSTLPPNLFRHSISTLPGLPGEVQQLMQNTHTWMGESIKFALTYKEPFWRNPGRSGTVFSNTGPVTEMYDHSDVEDRHYALKGFLNGAYYTMSEEERRSIILQQLRKYYGPAVDEFLNYYEKVWAREARTYAPYSDHILPHQHNGHEVFRTAYLDNRLFLAGSETAVNFPGYMDGAVGSAYFVYEQIKQKNEQYRSE